MPIKNFLARLAVKITGKKCTSCRHNYSGRCCHPDGSVFMRCWKSITRPGFEEKQLPLQGEMTPAERQQFEKIKEALQEAEDFARESGLLEED